MLSSFDLSFLMSFLKHFMFYQCLAQSSNHVRIPPIKGSCYTGMFPIFEPCQSESVQKCRRSEQLFIIIHITGTFADDTVDLSVHSSPVYASSKLQDYLDTLSEWLKDWRIKANESKSVHVTFSLQDETCPPITLSLQPIPNSEEAKQLRIYLENAYLHKKKSFRYQVKKLALASYSIF